MAMIKTYAYTYTHRPTKIEDYYYVIGESNNVVGIVKNPGGDDERVWYVGDDVHIIPNSSDSTGGGAKRMIGQIIEINEGPDNRWFRVRMYGSKAIELYDESRFANK